MIKDRKELIDIVEITFEDRDTLVLLRSEHKNMLQSSIDYGFSLSEKWKVNLKQINPKDLPTNEWCG